MRRCVRGVRSRWLWLLVLMACFCFMAPGPALAVGPYVVDGDTVLDQATGLEWQQADDGVQRDWQVAVDYCENLDQGGHVDWRLPNIVELRSLIDYSRYNPAIDTAAFSANSGAHWSSTRPALAGSVEVAWRVDFYSGAIESIFTTENFYVRCVRDDLSATSAKLVNGPYVVDGETVLDQGTWLEWQQSSNDAIFTWQGAIDYCENLDLGGHTDWRLPNIQELRSLVDYSRYLPAIDTTAFSVRPGTYWSSSSTSFEPLDAWGVDFLFGGYGYMGNKEYDENSARCVRAGLNSPFNPLIVSFTPEVGIVAGSTSLTIKGAGFGVVQGGGTVTIGGLASTITSWSTMQVIVVTPAHAAGAVDLVITADDGRSVTVSGVFVYQEVDCLGVSGGTATVDKCGICDADPASDCVKDCAGIWGGAATVDGCGVCDTNQANDCFRPAWGGGPYVVDGQTVLDQATGLEWQQSDNGAIYTWQGATDYCESLDLGGHADWRLPNMWELRSLVSYSRYNPAIDSNAFQSKSAGYWSVTTHPGGYPDLAWGVNFYDGRGSWTVKAGNGYARCVRAAGLSGSYNFLAGGPYMVDGQTVLDQGTGLEWQQSYSNVFYTWQEAVGYCEALDLGGHTDWRLPSIQELLSLVDYSRYHPAIDRTVFQAQSASYWSSTAFANGAGDEWYVHFGAGDDSWALKSNYIYVRCVRTGESLIIASIEPSIGSVNGGTAITIRGTGFGDMQGTGALTIDGIAATVTSWSPTQIGVVVPAHVAGVVDVVVSDANGRSMTMAGGFAYGVPDCLGVPGGTATLDNCGVCDSDPANDCVQDCAGVWGGAATIDNCGVCDSDPANDCVQDCASVWGGAATMDNCGVCDSDPANNCVQDCAGVWGGAATVDNCGVCDSDPANDCTSGGPILTTLAFPAINDGPRNDAWQNWISIQSKDPLQQANVTFSLYNSDGSLRLAVDALTPVNGSLVVTPNWLLHGALNVERFTGTIIASSAQPIIGMVNSISPSGSSYETYEAPVPQVSLFFPAAYDNYNATTRTGYQNLIHLQNVNPDPVSITVEYKDDYVGTVTDFYTIPGYGEYERNVRTVFGGPFNGTISVTATDKIAGILRHEYLVVNNVKATAMYEATVERNDIFYPYIKEESSIGRSNWYSIMNTSALPVACTLNFYADAGDAGAGPAFSDTFVVNPGERHISTPSYARYQDLKHSFSGSIAGFCSAPVMSIINVVEPVFKWVPSGGCPPGQICTLEIGGYYQISPDAEGLNDYEATVPKQDLVFSQVFDNVSGYVNELHLQNTNPFPVTVNLELYFNTGVILGSQIQTIGPYAKYIVRPYMLNQKIANYQTNGSLKVAVEGGSEISGVMVFRKNDFISVYEAISP